MRVTPTPKQAAAMKEIRRFHAEHNRVPKYHELAKNLGISRPGSAWHFVQRLVDRGHLVWKHRGYDLVRCGRVPFEGRLDP